MIVSIIIPVYNGAQFIKRAINSVLCQSAIDWELIVVDDHSTDTTEEIVKQMQLKDSRITFISNRGSGVTSARECGVKIASGEYLLFLDADDTIPFEVIKTMTNIIKNQPDVEMVIGDILNIQVDGVNHKTYGFHDIRKGRQLFDWIIDHRMGFLWGKMIKRDLFLSLPVVPRELKFCEDYVQMLQLSYMSHVIKHIGCTSYEYYQNETSTCNRLLSRNEFGMRFYDLCKTLRDLIEIGTFDNNANKRLKVMFLYYGRLYLWCMGRWGKDLQRLKASFNQYLHEGELRDDPSFKWLHYYRTKFTAFFPCIFAAIYIPLLRYKYHRIE